MSDFPPLVSMILSTAPSAVIVEAMITILKYVNNILSNPDEQKYRSINMENKTFEEKISKMIGFIDFLVSIGFIPVGSTLVLDGSTLEVSKLMIEAKKLIDKILDKLNVPYDQRPLIMRKDAKEIKKDIKTLNATVKMAMDNMLSSNFDAILKVGLIAITKYITNILAYPEDEKYRTINISNKTFEEKVLPIKGAIEFFYSLQFTESNMKGFPALILTNKSTHEVINIMIEAKKCLDNALDKLQVPEDERPGNKNISPSTKNTTNTFDPYKPVIARTANQPPRTESVTDKKLEELDIRRRKLEGNVENVARQTLVLLPKIDGSVASIQEYLVDQGPSLDEENGNNDSKIVAKTMMKKIANIGQDAPLTTKAIRDLEKAQKERVFSQTLVRIKFPDRICIQGYFHPRNTMLDVYNWIMECLIYIPDNINSITTSTTASKTKMGEFNDINATIFELYMTPPKQLYLQNKTLHDLKLVPAAIFHLSWKSKDIEDVIRSKATVGNAAGSYIHPSLFLQSSGKTDSYGYFPVGEKLIPESNNSMDIDDVAPAKQVVDSAIITAGDNKDKAEGKSSTSAPKWLKLEK